MRLLGTFVLRSTISCMSSPPTLRPPGPRTAQHRHHRRHHNHNNARRQRRRTISGRSMHKHQRSRIQPLHRSIVMRQLRPLIVFRILKAQYLRQLQRHRLGQHRPHDGLIARRRRQRTLVPIILIAIGGQQWQRRQRLFQRMRATRLLVHRLETVQDVLQHGVVLIGDVEEDAQHGDAVADAQRFRDVGETSLVRHDVQLQSVSDVCVCVGGCRCVRSDKIKTHKPQTF